MDAGVCNATAAKPREDNNDILREIAEQTKRTPGNIEKQMQHFKSMLVRSAEILPAELS